MEEDSTGDESWAEIAGSMAGRGLGVGVGVGGLGWWEVRKE